MSEHDPTDELGARLFKAAREEPPPAGALARALAAAREEHGRRASASRWGGPVRWALLASAAALAASVAMIARHEENADRISAEPPSLRRTRAEPVSSAPSPASSPTPSAALITALPSVPAPAPAHSATVSLSDELGALKIASSALASGDARAALTALDRYDRVLKGTKMRAEATLLRIEALSKAGQTATASALAERFVTQNPESPLVDRARSFIQQ